MHTIRYSQEMEDSSTIGSEVNGNIIKLKIRMCYYGRKACVKISKSATNPSKLYFVVVQGKCKCYSFWTLIIKSIAYMMMQ